MKKLICISSIIVLAFSLTACGSKTTSDVKSSPKTKAVTHKANKVDKPKAEVKTSEVKEDAPKAEVKTTQTTNNKNTTPTTTNNAPTPVPTATAQPSQPAHTHNFQPVYASVPHYEPNEYMDENGRGHCDWVITGYDQVVDHYACSCGATHY